jgi:hypothetical protein
MNELKTIILILVVLVPLVVTVLGIWAALVISGRQSPDPLDDVSEEPLLGRTDPAPVRRAMEAHRRANPCCFACGSSPVEIHHIIPVAVNPEKAADPGNLMSLCPPCHIAHGHAGDTGCRFYVPNVQKLIQLRLVMKI